MYVCMYVLSYYYLLFSRFTDFFIIEKKVHMHNKAEEVNVERGAHGFPYIKTVQVRM